MTSSAAKTSNTHQPAHKTLGSLLRYFEGLDIAVELKTGKIYQGTLVAADQDMTVTLDDCTVSRTLPSYAKQQQSSNHKNNDSNSSARPILQLKSVQIRGSQVRYIHFLDPSLDLALTVKRGMDRERAASQKYKRGIRK